MSSIKKSFAGMRGCEKFKIFVGDFKYEGIKMGEVKINIENIVASTGIADELDLKEIEKGLEGSEYNEKKFPGLVYRINNPKAAFLIFRSGKVNCTGAKSVEDVGKAVEYLVSKLKSMGIKVYDNPEVKIQNIVASADLGFDVNLNALAIGLGLENVEYEPEQFPGLVYRLDDPKVVILVFGSGKLVITGGKTEEDCRKSVERLKKQIEELGLV